MLEILEKKDYEKARHLFAEFEHLLVTAAVLDGNSPGCLYVDDTENPRSAYMTSAEGCFLSGDSHNAAFNAGLRDLALKPILAPALGVKYDGGLSFVIHPADWKQEFGKIFQERPPAFTGRKHYLCREVKIGW